MIRVSYEKPLGYYVNGVFVSRDKNRVMRENRHVSSVIMDNACGRAKLFGQTVTVYQFPDGRWWHDKMGQRC